MRADGRILRLGLPLLLLAVPASPARAQVFGNVQLQYQHVEDVRQFVQPDGSVRILRNSSELLLKSIDVRHQNYLRQNLLMDTDLQFTEQSDPGTSNRVRSPSGTLRLIHPMFQLTAQHRPTTTRTTGSGAASVSTLDTATTVDTRTTDQTMLLGHASVPGGLQLNATWLRQRRLGTTSSPNESSILRNARASMDRQRWSLYASAADQRQKGGPAQQVLGRQGQFGFGGLARLAPARTVSATLQYDFGRSRTRPSATYATTSTNQSAQLSGDWRPARTLTGALMYSWRRVGTESSRSTQLSDQEGTLIGRWTPTRGATISSGGGIRTQRAPDGRPRLLKYATAIAAGEGMLRPNWNVTGNVSHTTNWDPDRGTYGTEMLSGVTRMALNPRLTLDGTLSIAANGDTAAVQQRWTTIWTTRLQARPLRSLQLGAGLNSQRIGSGLLRPASMSRGGTVDVTWKPVPRVDAIGNYSINQTVSAPRQTTRTWSSNVRMQLTDRWQLQGIWTRTATPRLAAGLESIVTRDLATGRLLWQPVRNAAASVSLTSTDPGTELEARRVDATFTWSFGR